MGPVYAFMLFAVLIGGSSLVIDEANGDELPTTVEIFHTETLTTTLGGAGISEYLRPSIDIEQLSTEIAVRIDCYSDGSGELLITEGGQDFIRAIEFSSLDTVRDVLLTSAYMVCGRLWEKKYGDSRPRESKPAWYF
tara:strand:+ start:418 stop:828 length:411 start_codon:yes stop_codon:yes gene_type:complete